MISGGGATPEIRQNYSGGRIVFNAINPCLVTIIQKCSVCFSSLRGVSPPYRKGLYGLPSLPHAHGSDSPSVCPVLARAQFERYKKPFSTTHGRRQQWPNECFICHSIRTKITTTWGEISGSYRISPFMAKKDFRGLLRPLRNAQRWPGELNNCDMVLWFGGSTAASSEGRKPIFFQPSGRSGGRAAGRPKEGRNRVAGLELAHTQVAQGQPGVTGGRAAPEAASAPRISKSRINVTSYHGQLQHNTDSVPTAR